MNEIETVKISKQDRTKLFEISNRTVTDHALPNSSFGGWIKYLNKIIRESEQDEDKGNAQSELGSIYTLKQLIDAGKIPFCEDWIKGQ